MAVCPTSPGMLPAVMKRGASLLIAVALVAGCGGDDDDAAAVDDDYRAKITAIDKRIDDQFAKLGGTGQGASASASVPADVKREAAALVKVQRQGVTDLEALPPPEDVAEAVEAIIEGLRKQADAVDLALDDDGTTMEDLGAALLGNQPSPEAFKELADKGYLPPQPGG